ncbi:SGNH/GDSL hydrolase family protein [Catalinimonas niigatensis]|uniref:SGNH/GDSL hydrolase family protein n=1 Tax=Catalinimonas niigatensis TaxID=1397264 RepID=UPI002666CD74|nr:SGNH/GDSL hydrolase family protein [Catalinimonas niigatensis]WPP51572.1 SGNH/GDSL hydrolase family protein [Catalinimonas niigatensis]
MIMSCSADKVQKVVFFGDSITAAGASDPSGYINLMRQQLDTTEYQLIGKGIGGNKVTDLEKRIEDDVLALQPDIVFVYIGINDVWHFYGPEGAVGTEIDRYEEGLRTLASQLKEKNIRTIFCTPTVIGEDPAFDGEINDELDQYAEVVRKVADETGAELCDLRKEMKDYLKEKNTQSQNSGILTSDRVHMNQNGNQFLAEQMLPYLD